MQFSSDDRHIIVLKGDQTQTLAFAKHICQALDVLEVDHTNASQALGTEHDAVIFDLHQRFNANAFGAVSGTIRGGGFLILLQPNNFPIDSLFLKRFNTILNNTPKVRYLDTNKPADFTLSKPPKKQCNNAFATKDQAQTVEAIKKVVTGHRRRPLVITSDRGRGKSASLGIAIKALAHKGMNNIILCAPSKKSADIVFKHAELEDKNAGSHITFYSPDELHREKPKASLVLIDEAAAIPLPILSDLLKHYSRIVFASTEHGYEGCGRGFAINFRKVLDREAPQWNSYPLNTPIRWNTNDTLEQFTYDALLLNTDLKEQSCQGNLSSDDCVFKQINKETLCNDTPLLLDLFGLLVSAHYQTKPSDLMQMLDDESVSIYCLSSNQSSKQSSKQSIVAVALVISEGNINPELSDDIFAGKRRLQGHLVAQGLSSNVGIPSAIELKGERISRIAVHPQLQSKGLGTHLINTLLEQSTADYLSTSYGATEHLINFWNKLEFETVHLGIKRDASSGSHSVTMIKAKTQAGKDLLEEARSIFKQNFPQLLSDTFRDLETNIGLALLPNVEHHFSSDDLKRLSAFANDSRGYENSQYLLWDFALSSIANIRTLEQSEKDILIIKVLQKHSWDKIKLKMGKEITGKKQALALLRSTVSKLLEN